MKVVNLATVSVPTTAGGTEIFSSAAAIIATTEGLTAVIIDSSTDICLVDAGGSQVTSQIPGAVVGTAANSAAKIFAGVPYVVTHRSGPLRAIAVTATSTVKVTPVTGP